MQNKRVTLVKGRANTEYLGKESSGSRRSACLKTDNLSCPSGVILQPIECQNK